MIYCDYAAYLAQGGTMTETDFDRWAVRASRMIDSLSFGRAERYAEKLQTELSNACAQMTDVMVQREETLRATGDGVLSAASNDGYSESYAVQSDAAYFARLRGILVNCLGSDPYNLLYRGVCGC